MVLWAVLAIVIAAIYGARIGSDANNNTTKVCVAVTCNMESRGTEGTTALRQHTEQPSLGP